MTMQLLSPPEYNFFFFFLACLKRMLCVLESIYMLNYRTEKSADFFILKALSIYMSKALCVGSGKCLASPEVICN